MLHHFAAFFVPHEGFLRIFSGKKGSKKNPSGGKKQKNKRPSQSTNVLVGWLGEENDDATSNTIQSPPDLNGVAADIVVNPASSATADADSSSGDEMGTDFEEDSTNEEAFLQAGFEDVDPASVYDNGDFAIPQHSRASDFAVEIDQDDMLSHEINDDTDEPAYIDYFYGGKSELKQGTAKRRKSNFSRSELDKQYRIECMFIDTKL